MNIIFRKTFGAIYPFPAIVYWEERPDVFGWGIDLCWWRWGIRIDFLRGK